MKLETLTLNGTTYDSFPDGDAVKTTELQNAINTALAQAKASGEFDGKDGQDGYTPQKGIDYFDGEDGQDGSPGKDGSDGVSATHSWNGTVLTVTSASGTSSADIKGATGSPGKDGSAGADGVSPTVAVSKSGKVTTVSITDKNGTKTATINDGADGSPGSAGKDGTSVSVKSVSESAADGGSNVVTFSDGKTLTIKNGSKGNPGARGTSVLRVTTAPTAYTTATGGFTPAYRIALSTVLSQAGVSEVLVGDTVLRNYYTYPVGYVDANYVYLGAYASIRGSAGKTPVAGTDYFTEADKAEMVEAVLAAHPAKYEYAIENVLCIGDSLTAGGCVINNFNSELKQNYPYYLGRMLNCETTNAGTSGETISGWYANNIVTNKYDFADYDSAIIWLGTNSPCTAMPSDAEILAFTPSNAPDASTANHALYLCEIIKTIQTANPDCFILLCGIFSPSAKAESHNAVALQIANKYGVYFVDMTDLHPNTMPELHANLSDPHFGKAGNIFIANRLINYIREKISDNPIRAEFGYGDGSGGNIEPDNPAPSGNLVPYAIDTDGSVYNGTGYKDGYRLSGNPPAESVKAGMVVTGYIPVTASDVIRMAGTTWGTSPSSSYIYFFDENFNSLGSYNGGGYVGYEASYNGMTNAQVLQDKSKQSVSVENGVTTFNLVFNTADKSGTNSTIASSHITYMRIAAAGNGSDMIVTLNEEIT